MRYKLPVFDIIARELGLKFPWIERQRRLFMLRARKGMNQVFSVMKKTTSPKHFRVLLSLASRDTVLRRITLGELDYSSKSGLVAGRQLCR
jgi:hypothetical protein